jgi:hypothetical protein
MSLANMAERIRYGVITRPIRLRSAGAAPLGKRNSGTIAARLPLKQIMALAEEARRRRTTPSAIVRRALSVVHALSNASADPEKAFGAVAVALGLPDDADPAEVRQAFETLLANLPAPPPDSSAEVGDTPPPPKGAKPQPPPPAKLSAKTIAEIRKRGMTVKEFLAKRATVSRRA